MPIHDWTRVNAGSFHEFHQSWAVRLKDALNAGLLPVEYDAFVERDLEEVEGARSFGDRTNHLAERYALLANHIAIRHERGDVAAIVEIVSPGNRSSLRAKSALSRKKTDLLQQGIHLLVIDLFSPPNLATLESYHSGSDQKRSIQHAAVGDVLVDMPLFLKPGLHILAPLESTYQATWAVTPRSIRAAMTAEPSPTS